MSDSCWVGIRWFLGIFNGCGTVISSKLMWLHVQLYFTFSCALHTRSFVHNHFSQSPKISFNFLTVVLFTGQMPFLPPNEQQQHVKDNWTLLCQRSIWLMCGFSQISDWRYLKFWIWYLVGDQPSCVYDCLLCCHSSCYFAFSSTLFQASSVLWHCWMGNRKGIWSENVYCSTPQKVDFYRNM